MSTEQEAEFINPPSLIKAKVFCGNENAPVLDPVCLQRAQHAVAKMNEDYPRAALEDVAEIKGLLEAIVANPQDQETRISRIYTVSLNMKSHGGTFGYQLVSLVANSLKVFLEGRTKLEGLTNTVVQMHADTMSAIFKQDIKGHGSKIGRQMLLNLKKLVEKAIA